MLHSCAFQPAANWSQRSQQRQAWKYQLLECRYKFPHSDSQIHQHNQEPNQTTTTCYVLCQCTEVFFAEILLLQPKKCSLFNVQKATVGAAGLCSSIWHHLRWLPGWTLNQNNWPGQQHVRWTNEYLLLGDLMAKRKRYNTSPCVRKRTDYFK